MSLDPHDLLKYINSLENETKDLKLNVYRLGWFMRGSFSYEDLMFHISHDDKEILNKIIEQNLDTAAKTNLPFI